MKDKIKAMQTNSLVLQNGLITLVRNGFGATCPFQTKFLMPGRVEGSAEMQGTNCNSSCPFFKVEAPTAETPNPNGSTLVDNYQYSCQHNGTAILIDPANIKDIVKTAPILKI